MNDIDYIKAHLRQIIETTPSTSEKLTALQMLINMQPNPLTYSNMYDTMRTTFNEFGQPINY